MLDSTNPHVLVETGTLTKAFATHNTLVGAVFLVHVQDVDPQAVSFLKRSEGKRTF